MIENVEFFILIYFLRDVNFFKFFVEDVLLFESILDDLFLGVVFFELDYGVLEVLYLLYF